MMQKTPIIVLTIAVLCLGPLTFHSIYAQDSRKTSVEYIENARVILKQVSVEYKNGNYAKAEELAATAYLENIEYVEADLNKNGHSEMVTDLEKIMVTDLRGMIRDRVPQAQIDSEISLIDSKLSQAIAVVPEFPLAASFAVVGSMIAGIVAISRITGLRILGHRA